MPIPGKGKQGVPKPVERPSPVRARGEPLKGKIVRTFTKQAARVVSALAGQGTTVEDRRLPGEMHGLLQLPNGKFAFGNYIGPGTQLMTRLKRGDPGLTPVDKLAKKHDIDYSLATTKQDVINADRAMIGGLKGARRAGEKLFNIRQGQLMIPKAAYERLTGRTIFADLKGPGPNKAFLMAQRNK